jgi:hypothetical protein
MSTASHKATVRRYFEEALAKTTGTLSVREKLSFGFVRSTGIVMARGVERMTRALLKDEGRAAELSNTPTYQPESSGSLSWPTT